MSHKNFPKRLKVRYTYGYMDIDNLAGIVRDFMKDKYNRDVEYNLVRNMCIISYNTLSKEGHSDLPKKVIYAVKNALTREDAPTPSTRPAPPTDTNITKEDAADEFMTKLQELEITRNAALAASINRTPAPASAPDFLKSPEPPPAPPQSSTIVYLKDTAQKVVKSFFVNGCDRKWNYFHDRAVTVYNRAYQTGTTATLAAVSLPVSLVEPFVIIEIQGTTGHTVSIPCVHSVSGNIYNIYKPVCENVATFLVMAFPWTIKVTNTTNDTVDMGKDDAVITNVSAMLNGCLHVTLDKPDFCRASHTLLFMNASGDITEAAVLRALGADIEIGPGTRVHIGDCVCNKMQHMTLLFTTTKNDTPKNRE